MDDARWEYERDYAYGRDYVPVQRVPASRQAMFDGIVRADGRVATRNYVGILSTVNCSATVVRKIAEWFTPGRWPTIRMSTAWWPSAIRWAAAWR